MEQPTLNPDITVHAGDPDLLDVIQPLYAEVYAEPPYNEGPADVDDFIHRWNSQVRMTGFRVILARLDDSLVGFSFGFPLPPDTSWWNGLLDPAEEGLTTEYLGRTFAIIEIAVKAQYRRHGIGRTLHRALLHERKEERVTLLSRGDAEHAQAAYLAWGYRQVGRLRPGVGAPVYLAMIRNLP